MRVLILSCNTGEGHNSCAKAIKEVFEQKGDICTVEDSLRFISEGASRFISWGHVYVYRNLPWLFNWGYNFADSHGSVFKEENALYKFFGKGSEGLYNYITKGKYETVICSHPFSALMLSEMQKRYSLSIKTAFVATDYTCSPSVRDGRLDHCFIPDESLKNDFVCPNISEERIIASGIPIRQAFFERTAKSKAKEKLGIDPKTKHLVLMSGSMGCGPIKSLVEKLTEVLSDRVILTVVCGTNEKLLSQLTKKYGDRKNLRLRGFVTDMSSLLDSADIYLTKAGGISTTEASAKRVPMIFINAVGGCEYHNGEFFTRLGCAKKSSDTNDLVRICSLLLSDGDEYEKVVSAYKNLPTHNAAEIIYDTLVKGST